MKASLFCAIVSPDVLFVSGTSKHRVILDSIQQMEASGDTAGRAYRARPRRPGQSQQCPCLDRVCRVPGSLRRPGRARCLRQTPHRTPQWRRSAAHRRRRAPPGPARSSGRRPQRRQRPSRAVPRAAAARPSPSGLAARGEGRRTARTATIPGPLRSFARMAAYLPIPSPADVLPALARNVVTNGYQASHNNECARTDRISEARPPLPLAGARTGKAGRRSGKVIKIDNCESPAAGELLRILGFRMRGGCGSRSGARNRQRAARLPHHRFRLPASTTWNRRCAPIARSPTTFTPTSVPVHVRTRVLDAARRIRKAPTSSRPSSPIPRICRLYLGFSKLDPETAEAMRKAVSVHAPQGLSARAGFLRRHVRNPRRQGRHPGRPARRRRLGPNSPAPRPIKGAAFFDKLMAKDDGWLASLYDALARIHGPVQDYLTDPGAHEALLHRRPRPHHQSRPGAPGVPRQHRHDAAHHAPARGRQRQAAHPRQPGSVAQPLRQPSRRASTTAS